VITSTEEFIEAQKKCDISASWAGGENGTELVSQIIHEIPAILSSKGVFYLLAEQKNAPKLIEKEVKNVGLQFQLLTKKNISGEILMVYRIYH